MNPSRLARLARLTQGLALVGLGVSAPACGNSQATSEPPRDGNPHINAPPPTASVTASPTASVAPVATNTTDAGPATAATDGGGDEAAPLPKHVNSPPPRPELPKHINSRPPRPELPKHVNSPPPGPTASQPVAPPKPPTK